MTDPASGENFTDTALWLGVMHRRTVQDAEQIAALFERIARLERPWWRRVLFSRRRG